jgi:hypothetical protein
MPTTYTDETELDRTKSWTHRSERAAIELYLSDPSIAPEVAEAMSEAYSEACRALQMSGRKFSERAVATLIANFAHDGEHDEASLVAAVMSTYFPKRRDFTSQPPERKR